jgi:Ca2+-transporting ATPase
VLERLPAESSIMERPPRRPDEKLLTKRTLIKSILQGFAVLAASFGAYYLTLQTLPSNAPLARGMGLSVIFLANLFLVFVNSSDTDSLFKSVRRLMREKTVWVSSLGIILMLALILYTPLNGFLKLAAPSGLQLLTSLGLAAASVVWYELVKAARRRKGSDRT